MKRKLHKGGPNVLNIYTNSVGGQALGFSSYVIAIKKKKDE